jgi:hypothetical protein
MLLNWWAIYFNEAFWKNDEISGGSLRKNELFALAEK